MPRPILLALTALAPAVAALAVPPPPGAAQSAEPGPDGRAGALAARDSALDELRVGRSWHASRILRELGAASGTPEDVLLLARAEAGWKHHAAVIELLGDRPWLDDTGDGEGWRLLARAREGREEWSDAAAAWERWLSTPDAAAHPHADAMRVRAARDRARARPGETLQAVGRVPARDGLRSWLAAELAEARAQDGDTATVRALVAAVDHPDAADATWRVLADAFSEAGDDAGAAAAFLAARETSQGARRAVATAEAGLHLAEADEAERAIPLLREAVAEAPRATAGRAAEALLDLTEPDLDESLRLAAALDAAGRGGPALRAYDRAARLAGGPADLSANQRLARTALMATVRSRQGEALEEFRAIDEATADERIGARNLELWARMRARQGREPQVETLRRWLLERYPSSPEAAEVMWDRAWDAESGGDPPEAQRRYEELAERAGAHARAGQARMRVGQILAARGDFRQAAGVWERYLDDFPDGRRWEEAAFWAAWSHARAGRPEAGRPHIDRLRAQEPFSYYSVMAADLLGEPFALPVPDSPPASEPAWLMEGLERVDLLEAAGLTQGADAVVDALTARAASDPHATLRLAEALIDRGRTIPGINLGWALRRDGMAWNGRLLRVVYPFPDRERVRREAAEQGVDPLMMAALIRQESAFDEDIVSPAGAIGLMQVMPPTGRELARSHGPADFEPEALTTAEVNLHLGAVFFREMTERFGDLPLVLSAYNAGPTRARRWSAFPEAEDWLRFTERVPFPETRGYIKNVRRNLGVYRVLYGPVM